ncbi:MAG TPA: RNA 3'-terminal phosphate cyclase, partial [Polyangiaceae bacterium]|nr:RNA 3'-terminal phosphate cyclase [Polyangiaceae bacterium]
MLTIDGSVGEGGGQILRTALGLSLLTGEPLRIHRIRAGRRRPGLMRQHLTALRAAAQLGRAEVTGDALGSTELSFAPRGVEAGEYHFAVGTAGSTSLVLQTVLPALLTGPGPCSLVLEGGTHNPLAPCFDFLDRAFVPLVNRLGPRVTLRLERAGFYPAGGGRVRVEVHPAPALAPLRLLERGALRSRSVTALISGLPIEVAKRELARARELLVGWDDAPFRPRVQSQAVGPGNALIVEIASEHVTEVVTAVGERGVPAETVAERAAAEALAYEASGVPVGEHLADQL